MMETVQPHPYNQHLKKVLKTYQLNALKSLSGPSTVLASEDAKLENGKGLILIKKEALASNLECEPPRKIIASGSSAVTSTTAPPPTSSTVCVAPPPPFRIQQQPILSTSDQSKSDLIETTLEGETISCFVVGGERRLCLPQILNTVLSDFKLPEINKQCDRLQIFCSRCNTKQLNVLKVSGVLPMTAPSCGLMTQTDAERLCSALLHVNAPRSPNLKAMAGLVSFRVYHECFGDTQGLLYPDLYQDRHARCIECLECGRLFSPQHFVCHAHTDNENHICHWGFDSSKWRVYLLLVEGQPDNDILKKAFKDFKDRSITKTYASSKRKGLDSVPAIIDVKEEPASPVPPPPSTCNSTHTNSSSGAISKRPRLHDQEAAAAALNAAYYSVEPYLAHQFAAAWAYNPMAAVAPMNDHWARLPIPAAFRPWHSAAAAALAKDPNFLKTLTPPSSAALRDSLPSQMPAFLSQGPPVLLHPERVVPLSESERFELQPNVALAPNAQPQLLLLPRPPEVKKEVEAEGEEGEGEVTDDQHRGGRVSSLPNGVEGEEKKCSPSMVIDSSLVPQSSRPAYNPEIELSSDTEDSSSLADRSGGGGVEGASSMELAETELLERLARCVATCPAKQEEVRQQGENALRTLGVDLLALREARSRLTAENQMLRERMAELEDQIKTCNSIHAKELEVLTESLTQADRQRADLELELARSREGSELGSRSRESSAAPHSPSSTSTPRSPTLSVITSTTLSAPQSTEPASPLVKAEPPEPPPE